ncbi:protein RRP5 homolog [Athalia rosae]|uniref:protein RRP5 homolog n=1 Tax=Athalia rosae TaxID=37344 RepID=UPI0020343918|nr:protein RRP5 homolog [Athalia rosae]XP_012263942.2 protein RRP5 homolog [Athalia rosae]
MTLKSFPRGGRKPQKHVPSNNEIGKKSRSKSRDAKNYSTAAEPEDFQVAHLVAQTADCLNYSTLTQGMVVLGRVREAREYDLIISLPGRLIGRVQLTDISEGYTKLLQNMINAQDGRPHDYRPLSQLFKPGDYLVCHVKQLNLTEKWRVSLSLEPELVNQNLDRTRMIKRSRIIGSVSSIEEHGYVIDSGVANLRVFLASKDVDEDKSYFTGQQLSLMIKEVKTSDSASTITVSAKTKHNNQAVASDTQLLDALIPGTKLVLTVTKILPNGLQVNFNENNTGYINQIYLDKPLSSYQTNGTVRGTLLYILPTVKFAYFSLMSQEGETNTLNIGDIMTSAVPLCIEQKGILLKLPKNLRGFVPMRRTEVDFQKINSTFAPKTRHKCRVLNYDWFDRVYICSMQKEVMKEEHFTLTSFVPGELITAEIIKVDIEYGSVTILVNKIKGYVPPEHVCDTGANMIEILQAGQTVKARVLRNDIERNRLVCTMKQSLVESNLPILRNIKEATIGSQHHGTVVQVRNTGVLIQFFGDVKGWVPPRLLGCARDEIKRSFAVGQVQAPTIVKIDEKENRMTLSLLDLKDQTERKPKISLRVGEQVECVVTESSPQGVYVNIHKNDEKDTESGYLPAGHMAPSLEVASLLAARLTPGDKITATVFSNCPEIILTTSFTPQEDFTNFENLKVGQYLPCSVTEISKHSLKVLLPINNYDQLGIVPNSRPSYVGILHINQILIGKIININKINKQIELTTDLYDLWLDSVKQNSEMTNAVDVLSLYLNKVSELPEYDYYKSRPISKVTLGQRVTGKVEKVTEDGLVLCLNNDLRGTVRKDQSKKDLKVGDNVTGTILWINYVYEIVEVTLKSTVVNRIAAKQASLPSSILGTQLQAEIVLITNWFVLVVLKGKENGRLAALPARRHLNDVEPDLKPYGIGCKLKCFVVLKSEESSLLPICVLSSVFEGRNLKSIPKPANIEQKRKKRVASEKNAQTVPNKKAKLDNLEPDTITSSMEVEDSEIKSVKHAKQETTEESVKKKFRKSKAKVENEVVVKTKQKEKKATVDKKLETNDASIPECGFYWDATPTPQEPPPAESSSDSEEESKSPQKKKKLNAAERREQERQKEREIREREQALASNQLPNSPDQFDRLVMSTPDNSLIWVQYMAYHLQATEIEKARAVAKRAIRTINFREEDEKLNVWQAWLNLESRFGTLETLNEVFQEAVRTNDAFKIYVHMLTLHADANRQSALEKTITTITGKFKQNPQSWIECGTALLKIGLKDKSRHIMQRALQSLPAHQHVDLMVRFAQLENKHGDKERAQTLFEKVLSSYPKRVDVWSAYVDSLVKSGDIPIARQVLDRASAQTLPARKMKTIFKKFITFEEKYGTPENVANVQQMARTYVENKFADQ